MSLEACYIFYNFYPFTSVPDRWFQNEPIRDILIQKYYPLHLTSPDFKINNESFSKKISRIIIFI